jgi:signal transduction histidine kinase
LVFNGALFAQQPGLAKLRQGFISAKTDSLKMNRAKQLFGRYIYTKVDSAIYFAEQIVALAGQTNSDQDLLTGNNYLGIGYAIKGDYTTAVTFMRQVLDFHLQAADSLNMAYDYNNIGTNYLYAGDYLQATENFIQSVRIKEALVAAGVAAADVDLASTLMNIGLSYQNQQDTAQARVYFIKAIEEADNVENKSVVAQAQTGLGNVLAEQGQFSEAVELLKVAEATLVAQNDLYSLGKLYNNISLAYAGLQEGAQVIGYANKAIATNRQIGNTQSVALGYVYLGLGYIQTQQLLQAIEVSEEALSLGQASQDNTVMVGALKNLYEAHAALGNYEKAYAYSLEYNELDELMFTEERAAQMEQLSARYEADKREIQIENLSQETRLQALGLARSASERRLLLVLLGSLCIILLLVAYFYRKISQNRKLLAAKNLELDQLNKTKDRFFAIISHDLRGHISAFQGNGQLLRHLMTKNEPGKLDQVTDEIDRNAVALGELLENLLHWSMDQLGGYEPRPEAIQLHRAVDEILNSYLLLARAKGLELTADIDDSHRAMVDRNGFSVMIRNLIGNAIKFTETGGVIVETRLEEPYVVISIKDTGIGVPKGLRDSIFEIDEEKIRRGTRNEKGTGLGLNLASEFARANGGKLILKKSREPGSTFLLYLLHA